MGITSSLTTALSGLSTAQSEINVVGNNIANVNTTGFKSSSIDFQTQFLQNFSYGTAPNGTLGGTNPVQIGLGTTAGAITTDFSSGSLETTGVDTNLALQGNGMFILQNGSQQVYTRDGSFQLNSLNQLVSGTGQIVQGYGVDSNFDVVPGTLTNVTIPLGTLTLAQATQNTSFSGNLDAAGPLPTQVSTLNSQPLYLSNGSGGVDPTNPPTASTLLTDVTDSTGTPTFQMGDVITLNGTKGGNSVGAQTLTVTGTTTLGDLETFFTGTLGINTSAGANGAVATTPGVTIPTDATDTNAVDLTINGNPGTANDIVLNPNSLTITRAGSPVTPFTWNKTASADGESVATSTTAYDSLGNPVTVNVVATLNTESSSGSTWNFYATSPQDMPDTNGNVQTVIGMGTLSFDTSGQLTNAANATATINRAGTGAVPNLTFNLDFSKTTALNGTSSQLAASADGFQTGTLSSFDIGSDGTIAGTFTNGLTRTVGQVAVATFSNDQGLVNQGSNDFITGPNSGNAVITAPGQLGSGTITSGALELSNVDLSTEFVKLIAASTAFSASSRVISSSNTLLQSLLAAMQG